MLSIDTSEAEALEGVVCVLTQKDIPGQVNVGHLKKDQPTLIGIGELTHYLGDAVALVCAPKQAELAQRILLELKDKPGGAAPAEGGISLPAGDVPAASGSALALAQAALAELGYRPQEITAALRSFDPEGMKTEEIVRQCLRAMVMR